MSQIDLMEQSTPAISLFNAICKKYARDTLREDIHLPDGSVGEVKLTFNGVEIPFEASVEDLWRQVNDDIDARALIKAKGLISLAGLQEAMEKIERAEWEINNAVEEALKKLKAGG